MLYYCYFRPLKLLHERFPSKSTVNQQYQLRQLGNWTYTFGVIHLSFSVSV